MTLATIADKQATAAATASATQIEHRLIDLGELVANILSREEGPDPQVANILDVVNDGELADMDINGVAGQHRMYRVRALLMGAQALCTDSALNAALRSAISDASSILDLMCEGPIGTHQAELDRVGVPDSDMATGTLQAPTPTAEEPSDSVAELYQALASATGAALQAGDFIKQAQQDATGSLATMLEGAMSKCSQGLGAITRAGNALNQLVVAHRNLPEVMDNIACAENVQNKPMSELTMDDAVKISDMAIYAGALIDLVEERVARSDPTMEALTHALRRLILDLDGEVDSLLGKVLPAWRESA